MTIENKLSITMDQEISGLEGFTGATGDPLFLWFWDRADKVTLDVIRLTGYNYTDIKNCRKIF